MSERLISYGDESHAVRESSNPVNAKPILPAIRKIGLRDLRSALTAGIEDFLAMPSHVVFLSIIYPIFGLFVALISADHDVMPLLIPLTTGFALIGPFAALGLYELSRRRELGLDVSWKHAFSVWHSPSRNSIALLAIALLTILLAWLFVAQALYRFLHVDPMVSLPRFAYSLFTTSQGQTLLIVGGASGFLFATVVLATSVVSFPMLLDRNIGAGAAVLTSLRAVRSNPVPIALWGLIVAASLAFGSLPLFVGLAVVMPVLGHATWHLYRRLIN